jgi:putative membrane protein
MNFAAMLIDLSAPALRMFERFGDGWCGPMGGYWGGGMGGFWMIATVLFWVGILAIAALIISRLFARRGDATTGGSKTPMEILDRRYASGEITEKEYRKMKKGLSEK